jgi:type II secretory ATPase GspE/PulE/Tfp pilus assembly ATPase PilB-like protein
VKSATTVDFSRVAPLSDRLTAIYLEFNGVLPLSVDNGCVTVATWMPPPDVDPQVLDDMRFLFDAEPDVVQAPEADVRAAIRRVYGGEGVTAEGVIAGMDAGDGATPSSTETALDDLVHLANEGPVVKLVNLILLEALEARASDVHVEGYADTLRVRYRIDGVLQDGPAPPAHLKAAIVSRLKIMADLDIAERRVPQDGRIRLRLQDRQVDVRVSTVPVLHGESVVLRLLDKEHARIALEDLGMSDETARAFAEAIRRPHGIVLSTGPTGSGKTTTLYAAIDQIRTGREKILTVEDPVEYELPGVPQVPVHEKVGLTFATALRSLLRQDPDILLVGEIRDEDTAEIATHAALTGHLVLSTLHTNDAPSALVRLLDLGLAAYLVASTVEAVLAQRLVRRICATCGGQGTGCTECRETGFRGRTGIYELLVMTDELRKALPQNRGAGELRALAVAAGMRTLRDDGMRLVGLNITTLEEVDRVTTE